MFENTRKQMFKNSIIETYCEQLETQFVSGSLFVSYFEISRMFL